MEIQIRLENVKSLATGIWETSLTPSDVRRLGDNGKNFGAVSVVALSDRPLAKANEISFDAKTVSVLNVGTTDRTIIIDGYKAPSILDTLKQKYEQRRTSVGDQQFLDSLEKLPDSVRDAGRNLLVEVRVHFPGELKRITAMRFQETPDNFWFATVQPRAESLLITVRGLPERFKPSTIPILMDRRPYSRFKIQSVKDVPEAARIIRVAIKK